MPKANLRVLESPAGPFHREECSVWGERFYVPSETRDFEKLDEVVRQHEAVISDAMVARDGERIVLVWLLFEEIWLKFGLIRR
jgi:hypothetical protein